MTSAIKARVTQSTTYADYVASFKTARGVPVTSIIDYYKARRELWGKELVLVDVLMKGKKISYVKLKNGDCFHVSNEILTEAGA
jgi:hypothetical protein